MTAVSVPRGPALRHVLRGQLVALWSVPATRWLALLSTGLGVGYTAMATSFFPVSDQSAWVGAGTGYAAQVMAVLAAVATAGAWTTRTVQTELVAVPRRHELFLGKAAAVAVSGAALGTVTALLATIVAGGPAGGVRVVLTAGLVTAAFGLFGLAVGALARRLGPAVVAVVLLCLVLPPFTLGASVAGIDTATLTLTQSSAFLLGGQGVEPVALLTVVVWAVLPTALAFLRFRHTDA